MGLEDYVPVSHRIKLFRDDHPEGVISTTRLDVGEAVVVFIAQVYRNLDEVKVLGEHKLASATGHAEVEIQGEKDAEKCETVAIGRALAILGYASEAGIASAEEMEDVIKEDDDPPKRRRKSQKKEEEEEGGRRRRRRSSEKEEDEDNASEDTEKESEDKEDSSSRRRRQRSSRFG